MKNFLSNSEVEDLKTAHRSERSRKKPDRIKAVLLSNQGWSYSRIAEALLLDEETISTHVKEYKKSKKLTLASGGSSSKLSEMQTNELLQHLEVKTYTKVSEICAYVKVKYNVSYSTGGMTNFLHNNNFSYKQPKGTPAKADKAEQAKWIKLYEKLLNQTPEDEPIEFGDGVHPTMVTKITYGWIRKGSDKLIETTGSKTRMNIMGSINLETMDVSITKHDKLNSTSMKEHFSLLRKKYTTARKIHLILDQGSYNTSKETKKHAKEYGVLLHFLPPYSPNLNPIERLWKVMNEYCRNNKYFKNAKEFRTTIDNFFEKTWNDISKDMVDRIRNCTIIN